MCAKQDDIAEIAASARARVESWGIYRDEGLCAVASGYLCSRLREAGYPARVRRGYLRCDRPHRALRTPFFGAGRSVDHAIEEQHTWVEVDDLLVDITCAQFNDQLNEPLDTVCIGHVRNMDRHVHGVEVEAFEPQDPDDWRAVFMRKRHEVDRNAGTES